MASKKKRVDYICRQLGIKLRSFEPNPYKEELYSKYSIEDIGDCTIRALCRILNIKYDEAYKMMMDEASKLHLPSVGYTKVFANVLDSYGYEIWIWAPEKISIAEFMHTHKRGRYALIYENHVFAYINGTWYDSDKILKYADIELSYRLNYVICEHKYTEGF